MPHKSDDLVALADVFAKALLDAADEQGADEEVAEAFDDLVGYLERAPEFEGFLIAESVDDDSRRRSLERLFRGKMNDLLLNLLQVLNTRDRLHLLKPIHRAVVLRMEARRHQQEVVVESAMPLTDELRSAIKSQMSQRIGQEALLIEKVKPELIGGVVIHIGDVQIDGSVAMQLRRLRRRFGVRAADEIHSRRGYEV